MSGIKGYLTFADQLNADLQCFQDSSRELWIDRALLAVDGLAAEELRVRVSLNTRRQFGAFFTPSELAKKVAQNAFPVLNEKSVIYDPACGAGNLLLSCMDYLKEKSINPIRHHFLLGTDIHPEFILVCNSRIAIKRLLLQSGKIPFKAHNHNVMVADGLLNNPFYEVCTHVFINPPFNSMACPDDIGWSGGKVSAAAIFIDRIIKYIKPDTTITAILPEVLRSGSRYEAWRTMVKRFCTIDKLEMLGQFDKFADIDVFAIQLRRKRSVSTRIKVSSSFQPEQNSKRTIGDMFEICVGPVVDNRDVHEGKRRGYIVSKGLPGWSILKKYQKTRRHSGKVFSGPFVVIKRTSRMGDNHRAIGSIINTPHPVYVDNHLVVLIPKSGKISDCKKAIVNLKNVRTDNWMNKQIRCRHLTVNVISRIPIWQ